MAMELKQDIEQLYEIQGRIASLPSYHQWIDARDFREACEGIARAIAGLEKILLDLRQSNGN